MLMSSSQHFFDVNNKIDGTKNLFIMAIMLMLVGVLLITSFSYYLYKFYKAPVISKKVNYYWLSVLGILNTIQIILSIVSIIFYEKAFTIFGELNANKGYNTLLILNVLAFISLIFTVIVAWFSYSILATAITEDRFMFLGEYILYSKISKIIIDDNKNAIYINFLQGKRSKKRIKFSKKSSIGKMILENKENIKVTFENGDADEYFKTLSINK